MQVYFQKLLPHLAVILGFFIIATIYNYPVLEGKKLVQNDMIQASGSSQELKDFQEKTGEIPLWTNSMFGGMPSYLIYFDYPMSLTTRVGRLVTYAIPYPINLLFLYLTGFYLMGIMLNFRMDLSILGAIAFAFASYNLINIEAGHVSKAIAIAFAPPFVGAVIMTFRGKIWLGAALSGLFAGIQLYANHVQITYYLVMVLFLYVIFELIWRLQSRQENPQALAIFWKAILALGIAGALGIGSHASRLLTTYSYSQQSNRGASELKSNTESKGGTDRDYAFRWSYGVAETFTYLIPNFYGGGGGSGVLLGEDSNTAQALQNNRLNPQYALNMPYYWGGQPFTSGPAYMGAIVCFLFVLGLFLSPKSLKWWILGSVILLSLLAWGKNFSAFNYLIFDYLPLYNKFRAVTMVLSAVPIFLVWGAILGLQALLDSELVKTKGLWALKWSTGIVGGLCLFFAVMGSTLQNYRSQGVQDVQNEQGEIIQMNSDDALAKNLTQALQGNEAGAQEIIYALKKDRGVMQSQDAWRSLIFILFAAALIWIYISQKFSFTYLVLGLGLFTLIDQWGIDWRYLNDENFVKPSRYENLFQASTADQQIQLDKDLHFRVYNRNLSAFNDATTSYYHHSIGGYHGAKLRRYADIIEKHLSQGNYSVFNMLNTRYFIGQDEQGNELAMRNPQALDNAWFVEEYQIVKSPDEALDSLRNFNPAQTAIIHEEFAESLKGLQLKKDTSAKIKLTSYHPDRMVYESNASSEQLAIFSEIYYVNEGFSEWTAYIDGQEVPHMRANYILRALKVPAGKHKIEFVFSSPIYQKGEIIALICSLILFLGLGFALWKQFTLKNHQAPANEKAS